MPEQSEADDVTAFVRQLVARDVAQKNLCGHETRATRWTETCMRPKPCAQHGDEEATDA